jgi:hypothetical protein
MFHQILEFNSKASTFDKRARCVQSTPSNQQPTDSFQAQANLNDSSGNLTEQVILMSQAFTLRQLKALKINAFVVARSWHEGCLREGAHHVIFFDGVSQKTFTR